MKKTCIICNDANYQILTSYNSPDIYEKSVNVTKKKYYRKWVSCSRCKFIYSIYSRKDNALDKLYSSKSLCSKSNSRGSKPKCLLTGLSPRGSPDNA